MTAVRKNRTRIERRFVRNPCHSLAITPKTGEVSDIPIDSFLRRGAVTKYSRTELFLENLVWNCEPFESREQIAVFSENFEWMSKTPREPRSKKHVFFFSQELRLGFCEPFTRETGLVTRTELIVPRLPSTRAYRPGPTVPTQAPKVFGPTPARSKCFGSTPPQ